MFRFRILIVEDDDLTSRQLKSLISEQVEDVLIDTAKNVPQARQQLEDALKNKDPYHAFILDLKLPPEAGLEAEVDNSLCQAIRAKMSDALVAHITAWERDKLVKTHFDQLHDRRTDRSFRLAKGKGFGKALVNELKPFLYGLRIRYKLQRLFDGPYVNSYPSFSVARRRDVLGGRSITHDLADVVSDISTHWKDLEPADQNGIRESFNVTETGDKVIVSLF